MEARALTIRQPWITLILMGRKGFESRAANTKRRGRVYLHAAATMGKREREAAIREGLDPDTLPRGVIVGSAEIVDAKPAAQLHLTADERRRGDYGPDRWGWKLSNVDALPRPVPCAGALSFWQVPADVVSEIEAQADGRVFVYGTLKRGCSNHGLLAGSAFVGVDRINGTMHDLGSFPAVHLASAGIVHGEVYRVTADTLRRLDRLEGIPILYQRTRVRMSTNAVAWVYVMTPDRLASRQVVASGRWERT